MDQQDQDTHEEAALIQAASAALETGGEAGAAAETSLAAARKLTAEEQLALFEKALKEEDWGHQPC